MSNRMLEKIVLNIQSYQTSVFKYRKTSSLPKTTCHHIAMMVGCRGQRREVADPQTLTIRGYKNKRSTIRSYELD